MDVLHKAEKEIVANIESLYQQIGYETLEISSYSKLNLVILQNILKDKVSVFFGHSGSGKSTLVNALQPELNLKTSEISETHLKGKHLSLIHI